MVYVILDVIEETLMTSTSPFAHLIQNDLNSSGLNISSVSAVTSFTPYVEFLIQVLVLSEPPMTTS